MANDATWASPSGPLWAVLLIVAGATITLFANLITEITRRKMNSSTRWDDARLEVFSNYAALLGRAVWSASREPVKKLIPEVNTAYHRIVLLGSATTVSAADRAWSASADYAASLPATDDDTVSAEGPGVSYTDVNTRRVALTTESSRLQSIAIEAINTFTNEARRELGIARLASGSIGRPW